MNEEPGLPKDEFIIVNRITDFDAAREEFYDFMSDRVFEVDYDTYQLEPGYTGLARMESQIFLQTDGTKVMKNPRVLINKDSPICSPLYADLKPIVVRHELAELWAYVKTGYSLSPRPKGMTQEKMKDIAHGIGLIEEIKYAIELGLAEKYMAFMREYATYYNRPDIIDENERAYEIVKTRQARKALRR